MELTTKYWSTTVAMTFDLTTVLSDLDRVVHHIFVDQGRKYASLERFFRTTIETSKDTVLSVLERVMAAHIFTKSSRDMHGTFVMSNSDANGYKWQPSSKSVVKLLSHKIIKIEWELDNLGVMKNMDVEEIVKDLLTR